MAMRSVLLLILLWHGAAAAAPGRLQDTSTRDTLRIVGKDVPARDIPAIAAHVGLPVEGMVDVDIDVAVPGGDYSRATGKITVACTKCRIGDDVAKLKVVTKSKRTAAFAGDGIDFGHLEIDRFEAQLAIDKGKLVLKDWKVVSKDLDFKLALTLDLGARFADSKVRGCMKFLPTAALQKREPKTHAAISTTGAVLGPDNLFHIVLEGTFGELKRLAREC